MFCPRTLCARGGVCIHETSQSQGSLLGRSGVGNLCLYFSVPWPLPVQPWILSSWKCGSSPMCPHRSFSVACTASTFCWNLPLAVMDRSLGMVSAGMRFVSLLFHLLSWIPQAPRICAEISWFKWSFLATSDDWIPLTCLPCHPRIKTVASHSGMLSPAQKSVPREVVQQRSLSDHYRQWSKKTNSTVFATTTSVDGVRAESPEGHKVCNKGWCIINEHHVST